MKLKNLIRKPNKGLVISFIGTDGSGKSTIIESIKPSLIKIFNQGVHYEHLRPNKFPSIARLFGKSESSEQAVIDPHSSPQSGYFISLIRWSYYMLDYTLGFYIKVFPKVKSGSCIWIFDRYYYDYFIDPIRLRINLPKFILKLGQFIIWEPDIIICLGTKAEIIHKRKPELPLSEVKRQVMELRNFCKHNKRSLWIDTGDDIDISVNQTLEAIMTYLHKYQLK